MLRAGGLGQAVEEPGHDEQGRPAQQTGRQPEDGASRLRRLSGDKRVEHYVQESHHEVG